MGKHKHKYFRNLKYKQKLDHKADAHGYFQGIMYLTEVPDEVQNYKYFTLVEPDYRNYYSYFNRPRVPYIVVRRYFNCAWKCKRYYKKYSNKKIRRIKNVRNHANYKKHFDLWWTIL